MATITLEKGIDAPPEVVYAVATDLDAWPATIRGIERIERLTEGPVRVGTRFREPRKMSGGEAVERMEFAALDPPHGYTLRAESCGCLFESEHRFTPDGAGTLVELTIRTKPLTLVAKLTAPLGA